MLSLGNLESKVKASVIIIIIIIIIISVSGSSSYIENIEDDVTLWVRLWPVYCLEDVNISGSIHIILPTGFLSYF